MATQEIASPHWKGSYPAHRTNARACYSMLLVSKRGAKLAARPHSCGGLVAALARADHRAWLGIACRNDASIAEGRSSATAPYVRAHGHAGRGPGRRGFAWRAGGDSGCLIDHTTLPRESLSSR